jgi:hypothetical protein
MAAKRNVARRSRFYYAPNGNEKLAELLKAESEARDARHGIWIDEFYAYTSADDAHEKEGQFAFVTGKVVKAEHVKNLVYLNFGPDWHEAFTVTTAAHDLRSFRRQDVDPLTFDGNITRARLGTAQLSARDRYYRSRAD